MFHKRKLPILLSAAALLVFACTSVEDQIAQKTAAANSRNAENAASKPEGGAVFRKYCVTCHGADGTLGLNGAKDLSKSALTLEERVQMVAKGKGLMTPFQEILSPAEIRAVAEFTTNLSK